MATLDTGYAYHTVTEKQEISRKDKVESVSIKESMDNMFVTLARKCFEERREKE